MQFVDLLIRDHTKEQTFNLGLPIVNSARAPRVNSAIELLEQLRRTGINKGQHVFQKDRAQLLLAVDPEERVVDSGPGQRISRLSALSLRPQTLHWLR